MESTFRSMRGIVSKKKRRFQQDGFDLDLTYITPRVIAMGFPSSGAEAMYRNPLPEVQKFFNKYHKGHFRLYNLCSEREYPESEFGGAVVRFPFDDHNPCPLAMIGKFCTNVEAFLNKDEKNVVAIHCKAGKGRTGLMVSAYLVHAGLQPSAKAALLYFSESRTANREGVTIPSQMRFVYYYERVLAHGYPVEHTYKITHIRINTVPNLKTGGGCEPYFAVFMGGRKAYDYKHSTKKLKRARPGDFHIDFDTGKEGVLVKGDVKIQFYDHDTVGKSKLCHFWFNTGFVESNYLMFTKRMIDKACKSKSPIKFDPDFSIEVYLHTVKGADMIVEVDAAAEADEVDSDTDTDEDEHKE